MQTEDKITKSDVTAWPSQNQCTGINILAFCWY